MISFDRLAATWNAGVCMIRKQRISGYYGTLRKTFEETSVTQTVTRIEYFESFERVLRLVS